MCVVCVSYEFHVLSLDSFEFGLDLSFEDDPITILNGQVWKLRTHKIAFVKV